MEEPMETEQALAQDDWRRTALFDSLFDMAYDPDKLDNLMNVLRGCSEQERYSLFAEHPYILHHMVVVPMAADQRRRLFKRIIEEFERPPRISLLSIRDISGNMLLNQAVLFKEADLVDYLISIRAPMNDPNLIPEKTVVAQAFFTENVKILETLLRAGLMPAYLVEPFQTDEMNRELQAIKLKTPELTTLAREISINIRDQCRANWRSHRFNMNSLQRGPTLRLVPEEPLICLDPHDLPNPSHSTHSFSFRWRINRGDSIMMFLSYTRWCNQQGQFVIENCRVEMNDSALMCRTDRPQSPVSFWDWGTTQRDNPKPGRFFQLKPSSFRTLFRTSSSHKNWTLKLNLKPFPENQFVTCCLMKFEETQAPPFRAWKTHNT